jgi:hypothetical protein
MMTPSAYVIAEGDLHRDASRAGLSRHQKATDINGTTYSPTTG